MAKLILARHGVTPYNEEGLWTGITDVDMSPKGYEEVEKGAGIIARYHIDIALTSTLVRGRNTAKITLAQQKKHDIPLLETPLLNEKDYGVFTGKNKHRVRAEVGDETFMQIRRSWDYKIEGGESLRDVHARVMLLHREVVLPILKSGRTVYISAHNNTLRALVKDLEDIPDKEASGIELGTAEVRIYDFSDGNFVLEEKHAIGDVH